MRILTIILISFLLLNCSTQKEHKITHHAFNTITFGKGGGFTSSSNIYQMDATGTVSKILDDSLHIINTIKKKELRNISDQIEKIGFENIQLKETGNMTYFIEIQKGEKKHKVSWSDASQAPEMMELYKILSSTLKKK